MVILGPSFLIVVFPIKVKMLALCPFDLFKKAIYVLMVDGKPFGSTLQYLKPFFL